MTNRSRNLVLGLTFASLLACGNSSCASGVKFDWPGSKSGTCYPSVGEYMTSEYPWTEVEPDENIIIKEAAPEADYVWIIDKTTSINSSATLMKKSKHEVCVVLSAIHASSIESEFGPHGTPPATIITYSTAAPDFTAIKVTYTLNHELSRYFPERCDELIESGRLRRISCASAFAND